MRTEGKAKDLLLINALLQLMKELIVQSRVILKKLAVPHLVNNSLCPPLWNPKVPYHMWFIYQQLHFLLNLETFKFTLEYA